MVSNCTMGLSVTLSIVSEQTVAVVLFCIGLTVLTILTAMIYYYDRKYYGEDGGQVETKQGKI